MASWPTGVPLVNHAAIWIINTFPHCVSWRERAFARVEGLGGGLVGALEGALEGVSFQPLLWTSSRFPRDWAEGSLRDKEWDESVALGGLWACVMAA